MILSDLVRMGGDPAGAAMMCLRVLNLYSQQQNPAGRSFAFAGLAHCKHVMGREAERDEALLEALDSALDAGTDAARLYVLDYIDKLMGGPEEAQAWLVHQGVLEQPSSA
jgi:hypothetical protein